MDPNAKQLAVERLKNSTNVLVTVSANPTVDDLAALIGLSLLLGKLNKHASAVFSGQVPPAIEFLEPNKQLAKDVSSLRDFIIALDKSKADKLRYKVEENVVKIFITPYKTSLTKDDLSFSEGDFNVDTIVALGVGKRDDLDNAIKAHGRILHDATVITVNAGPKTSDLGAIDWQDPTASSLCEMLVSISESFGSGLLDQQISTAFLTGIVAATDRFSNPKTNPKVMTMAAQLMAAGANQQLISNNLQVSPPPVSELPPVQDDSQLSIDHGDKPPPATPTPAPLPLPQADLPLPPPTGSKSETDKPHDKSIKELEDEISSLAREAKPKPKSSEESLPAPGVSKSDSIKPDGPPSSLPPPSQQDQAKPIMDSYDTPEPGVIGHPKGHGPREMDEDLMMGGTFNATSQQAHDETISDLRKSVNSTLLNHPGKPLDDDKAPPPDQPPSKAPTVQPLTMSPPPDLPVPPPPRTEPVNAAGPNPVSPPSELNVDAARKEVEEAMSAQTFDPALHPLESIGAQALPDGDSLGSASSEISIDPNGNLQQPGQTTVPPPGDPNQEFKLPS